MDLKQWLYMQIDDKTIKICIPAMWTMDKIVEIIRKEIKLYKSEIVDLAEKLTD